MPAVNSSQSETVFGAQQLAVIRQYLSSVDLGAVPAPQGFHFEINERPEDVQGK